MPAPALRTTWLHALAWRLQRQLLEPVGSESVAEVVRRLCGVQAQVASSAELAVRLRRVRSQPAEVAQALADGRLVKTWAMRGALHLLSPADAGAMLSLLASGRPWDRPSWQRYFGVTTADVEALREAAREALDGVVLTREELIDAIVRRAPLRHLADELRSGWGTLLKPLAYQGELVYGPSRGTRVTFTSPKSASTRWTGVPDADEAGPGVVRAYLGAYGPATIDNFASWLSAGVSRRALKRWFEAAAGELAQIEVDGEAAYARAEDIDELAAARPSRAVRLLGGFDQWVLGPGTADTHVIPPGRRPAVSRQAGWIAPIVVVGGVVGGTWQLDGDHAVVSWFDEVRRPSKSALAAEIERLGAVLGRPLTYDIGALGSRGPKR